jgi:hypothetical protein
MQSLNQRSWGNIPIDDVERKAKQLGLVPARRKLARDQIAWCVADFDETACERCLAHQSRLGQSSRPWKISSLSWANDPSAAFGNLD